MVHEKVEGLRAAALTLAHACDLPSLLAASVRAAAHVCPFDVALAVACDPDGSVVATHAFGLTDAAASRLTTATVATMRAAPTSVDWVALRPGGEGLCPDPPWANALSEAAVSSRLQNVCLVPIAARGGHDLVLVLGRRNGNVWDEELEMPVLALLAQQVALLVPHLEPRPAPPSTDGCLERALAVALDLNAGVQVDELMQLIARSALESVGATSCCVGLLDSEGERFAECYSVSAGEEEGAPGTDASRLLAAGAVGRQSVEQRDVACLKVPGGMQFAAPMLVGGACVGVLALEIAGEGDLRPENVRGLRLLAAQGAAAIQRTRLQEVAERRSQHMEVIAAQAWQEEAKARALFEIAAAVTEKTELQEILADVARSACDEIGFERVRVYLADHDHQVLTAQMSMEAGGEPTPLHDSLVPLRPDPSNPLVEAALSDAPYMLDTVEESEEGAVCRYERLYTPMVAQQTLVGIVVADNPRSGTPVSARQTRLLRALAGLASVAIERARVEKLRGALISAVSHELRAPLASIRAYNELVLGGDAGPINDEQRAFLERVDKASQRLERLICDLMNLSKLRAGEVAVSRQPTDVSLAIQDVLDVMRPKATEAQVALEYEQVEGLPRAITDPSRLEQVLTNLVDNAIKFHSPGGWVRLTAQVVGDEMVIAVADNGPGIPASHKHLIFEEFQHGTDSRSRAKEGAGLGLSIARRLMEVMGGRLWVESEVGRGSTFYCALPLAGATEGAGA